MFGTYTYTFECLVKNDDDDAFLDFFFEELVREIDDFLTIVFFFLVLVVVATTKSSSESDENLAGALICLLEEDGLRSFVVVDIKLLSILIERNSPKYTRVENEEKDCKIFGEKETEKNLEWNSIVKRRPHHAPPPTRDDNDQLSRFSFRCCELRDS